MLLIRWCSHVALMRIFNVDSEAEGIDYDVQLFCTPPTYMIFSSTR